MTLFDIHKEFDEINGITIMALEVFVVTRPGCVPNYERDPISAVFFVIENECARLNLGEKYSRIHGVIANK